MSEDYPIPTIHVYAMRKNKAPVGFAPWPEPPKKKRKKKKKKRK